MKKYINGRVYDTEKAKKIGSSDAFLALHISPESPLFFQESLFRKKGGEFFLYGEGRQLTRYEGGEKIIPIQEEEARRWVKDHLGEDVEKKLFEPDDNDPDALRLCTYRIPRWLHMLAREEAREKDITISEVLTAALEEYLLKSSEKVDGKEE